MSVLVMEIATVPGTPATNFIILYPKVDGKFYYKGDDGIEHALIGVGVPAGGTTGQALVKASGTDYDTAWATIVSAPTGTPNALTWFDGSGDLASLNGWSVNQYNGINSQNTIITPIDAGDVYVKYFGSEIEINPALSTAQFHPFHVTFDAHVDRTGSGFNLNDFTNFSMTSTAEGNGIIQNFTGANSYIGMGVGANTGTIVNGTHAVFNTNIGNGYTVNSLYNFQNLVNIQSGGILTDLTMLSLGVSGDILGQLNGIFYNHNGNVGTNANLFNLGLSGNVTGFTELLSSGFNGDTNGLILLNLSANGSSHGNVGGINLTLGNTANTTGKIGFNMNLGGGTCSSGGRFFELNAGNGTYSNFIGLNINHNSIDPGGNEICFNLGKSTVDSVNYTGLNYGATGPSSNSWYGILMSAYPTGTTNNYCGLQISPGAFTANNQPRGVSVNLSQVAYAGQGFKTAFDSNGSGLNINYDFSTQDTVFPNAVFTPNAISANLTVVAGFPITNTGPFTPPFGFLTAVGGGITANDNIDPDFTGARLGVSLVGSFGQVSVANTKTVDMVNMNMAAAIFTAASTGGTITDFNGFRAVGILDGSGGSGSLNITNAKGFLVDAAYATIPATNRWGFRDDSASENFVSKIAIGTASKKVSGSYILEVNGDSFLNGALAVSGNVGFFSTAPVAQQTGGASTAGAIYGGTEQTMLQVVYDALRAYGLLS